MKKLILLLLLVYYSTCFAQHTAYWNHKVSMFSILPNNSGEIIFLGDDNIDRCEWFELFSNSNVRNRGLSADKTSGVLDRLSEVTESKPDKIFLMIGVNDLRHNVTLDQILNNYAQITSRIIEDSPDTKIFIQSLLPVNNSIGNSGTTNQKIIELNSQLKNFAENDSLQFIDLYNHFLNSSGNLNEIYSEDGLHVNGPGYLVWKNVVEEFVNTNVSGISSKLNEGRVLDSYNLSPYPNPFNGEVTIKYNLPESASVNFIIFDLLVREVFSSEENQINKGLHSFKWNSGNSNSGIYFVVMKADGVYKSKTKIILLK